MPAATVNALSTTQVSSLSYDQATAMLNNPNSGSFSSSITSALNSVISNSNTSNTSNNMSNKIQRFDLVTLLFSFVAVFWLYF